MAADLKFAKTHEWVRVEGNVATVGITDFAVHALTDLVFIELPRPGRALRPREVFGVVESVKAASDLYAPIAGTVTESNTQLEGDLSILTTDPFGAGWMVRLELSGPPTLDGLMDEAAYKSFCEADSH